MEIAICHGRFSKAGLERSPLIRLVKRCNRPKNNRLIAESLARAQEQKKQTAAPNSYRKWAAASKQMLLESIERR